MAHRVLIPPCPPPAQVAFVEDEFIATDGQVLFTLSHPFLAGGFSVVTINGATYAEGTDYLISGTNLQWLNSEFTLQAGDEVLVYYQVS